MSRHQVAMFVFLTSSEFTDGADCTQQITSGTFLSNNNGMVDTSGETGSFTMVADNWIECEFCVQLRSADLACPDYVDLRIVETGGVTY